ncbi:MAG: carboxypeptidase regulatory-like domain-containing protein [Candidatus Izemoplasmatales bacterium]|nr:carboxypeptidase regulatory-like domain-containing protein [Candidatus Izemoplasmatales bacterium]
MKKILFSLMAFVVLFGLMACNDASTTNTPLTTTSTTSPTTTVTQEPTSDSTITTASTTIVAQNRTINGVVLADDEPVVGATVRIRNTSYQVETGSDGGFSFEITESEDSLPEFRLIITKEGFVQATKDVLAVDFVSKVASVEISLNSATVTLHGVVSDASGVLEGVTVEISGTDVSTTTNASGEYTLSIDRPLGVTLVFSKEYYESNSLVLSNFTTGNSFENNVTLTEMALSVSGTVFNFASGPIAGAVVSIEGTLYETISGEDGSYSFDDLSLASDEFTLLVSKDGYLDGSVSSTNFENNSEVDLELVADYISLGILDAPYNVEGFLTKSSTGFHFQFLADDFRYESGKEEKIQVYFNPGPYTENTRTGGSHTIEVALTSNNDIVVVVSYLNGVSFLTSILWGTEVNFFTEEVDGKVLISLYVKYSVFGDYAGVDFAIDSDDVVGLGLNFWTDHDTVNLYHWARPDMLGVDGKAIVAHDNPQDWIRIAPDGRSLFEGSSNTVLTPAERTITGVVSMDSTPVENATVMIEGLEISATTNANGEYSLVVPADKINVSVLSITATHPGYIYQGTVVSDAFTDNQATVNIALEPVITNLNVSGNVENVEGLPLDGVTVSIRGTDFSTTTDSEGFFAFVDIAHTSTPYTLDFSKDGFKDKSLSQNNLEVSLTEPIVLSVALPVQVGHVDINLTDTPVYLGTVGPDQFEVYLAYFEGKITLTYVSTSGAFTTAPFEERLSQYFKFGDSETYEVRAINGSWTGVYMVESAAWATWTPEIHNPVITDVDGVFTLSQDIELSYFTNLGLTLDNVYFCVFEKTAEGEDALVYLDENQLSINDNSNWLRLVIPTEGGGEVIESPVVTLTNEFQVLGTFGEDNITGSIRYEDGSIITQYVMASGSFTNTGYEEAIRQYLVFGDSEIHEVRLVTNAWTGVYLPTSATFGAWTPEIGVPVIVDDGTNVTYTQTIQLSYFTNLGFSLDDIRLGLFENTETGNHVLTYNDVELVISNQQTWITLELPMVIEE